MKKGKDQPLETLPARTDGAVLEVVEDVLDEVDEEEEDDDEGADEAVDAADECDANCGLLLMERACACAWLRACASSCEAPLCDLCPSPSATNDPFDGCCCCGCFAFALIRSMTVAMAAFPPMKS